MPREKTTSSSQSTIKPQPIRGSILIGGKQVPISSATVDSQDGVSPEQIIKIINQASKKAIFPPPLSP